MPFFCFDESPAPVEVFETERCGRKLNHNAAIHDRMADSIDPQCNQLAQYRDLAPEDYDALLEGLCGRWGESSGGFADNGCRHSPVKIQISMEGGKEKTSGRVFF